MKQESLSQTRGEVSSRQEPGDSAAEEKFKELEGYKSFIDEINGLRTTNLGMPRLGPRCGVPVGWVPPHREFAIGFLDFIQTRTTRYAQYFIVISSRSHALCRGAGIRRLLPLSIL